MEKKIYQFLEGWNTGGTLTVWPDGAQVMTYRDGKEMNFRKIHENEIERWLKDEFVIEL